MSGGIYFTWVCGNLFLAGGRHPAYGPGIPKCCLFYGLPLKSSMGKTKQPCRLHQPYAPVNPVPVPRCFTAMIGQHPLFKVSIFAGTPGRIIALTIHLNLNVHLTHN